MTSGDEGVVEREILLALLDLLKYKPLRRIPARRPQVKLVCQLLLQSPDTLFLISPTFLEEHLVDLLSSAFRRRHHSTTQFHCRLLLGRLATDHPPCSQDIQEWTRMSFDQILDGSGEDREYLLEFLTEHTPETAIAEVPASSRACIFLLAIRMVLELDEFTRFLRLASGDIRLVSPPLFDEGYGSSLNFLANLLGFPTIAPWDFLEPRARVLERWARTGCPRVQRAKLYLEAGQAFDNVERTRCARRCLDLPHFRGQFSACDFLLLTAPPFEVDG